MRHKGIYQQINLDCQAIKVVEDCLSIPLDRKDVILGVKWLYTLGPTSIIRAVLDLTVMTERETVKLCRDCTLGYSGIVGSGSMPRRDGVVG